jgi:pimeloyl-ACP methyl ester carboxylesterase
MRSRRASELQARGVHPLIQNVHEELTGPMKGDQTLPLTGLSAPMTTSTRATRWPTHGILAVVLVVLAACGGAPRVDAAQKEPGTGSSESTKGKLVPEGAIDPEATNFPYPFPVGFFPVEVERQPVRMAFMDVTPTVRPNGRTVVLLHGKNFSGAYWEPTMRALVAEGFRVVVPDQIGFGKSSKPAAFQFSFHLLADVTGALLDFLRIDRFTVVGHSMGGMLATRLALMFPERVERLVLVNPIGLEDWKTVVPYRSIDEAYAEELRATPETIRNYQRTRYYAGRWEPEYEKLIALQAGWTLHPDYPRVAWCAALTTDMVFTQPVVYEFPRVGAPTLLIIGQRDRTAVGSTWAPKEVAARLGDYPTLGRKAAAAIPGAKLVEIEGVGHLPQVEAFERYRRALLDFIR